MKRMRGGALPVGLEGAEPRRGVSEARPLDAFFPFSLRETGPGGEGSTP